VTIKKLAAGTYMFGTKRITAKIMNDKLLIRYGSGYVSCEDFVKKYGRHEEIKANIGDFDHNA
jgi:hypothetical protein